MRKFFSLVSDGKGKIMYFDWKIRKQILDGKLNYSADSHTSIADYFGYEGAKEDTLNKYEYNPLTKSFQIDQINTIDDSYTINQFCKELDFKKIIPQLNIHDIVHPFKDRNCTKVTKKDLALLKKWDSVRGSVEGSVGGSVEGSVADSVWDSVADSVEGSVADSVADSVWDSVGGSVEGSVADSVADSVWGSVWDSVWAYISSFFNLETWKYIKHKKGENPYQCLIDLWNKGLVPSYDGKIWRLHGGKEGKVLWEGKV